MAIVNNPDLIAERHSAGLKKNQFFHAVKADKESRPNRWNIDLRTEVNEEIRTVEWLFKEGWYQNCINRAESAMNAYKLGSRAARGPEDDSAPKKPRSKKK